MKCFIMPRKKAPKKEKEFTTTDFNKFLKAEMKRTGRTAGQIIEETFGDGFVRYVEETGKPDKLSAWVGTSLATKTAKKIADYRDLRANFAPVSQCVDYLKTVILGTDVDVQIEDPKDTFQKKIKEDLQYFVRNVRQDIYTRGLFTILDIMLDEALTTGSGGAEIVYGKNPTFSEYMTNARVEKVTVKGKKKKKNMFMIDISDPWKDWIPPENDDDDQGLGGIVRLKIFPNGTLRLKRYKDPASWEVMYWTLDEAGTPSLEEEVRKRQGVTRRGTSKQMVIRYHPWQLFWLAINRRDWDVRGESVIAPVYSIAKTLKRIIEAVGEGIYRAGNKKYFVVTGTEKRPWSSPHIRDVMSEIQEMGEKNWTTVPVPAGFDIKGIGGEVFEAQNIIAVLLTLIAHGMNCPKEILGLSSRGSGERQFTVSHVEVERMKNNFKFAVEDQLFARHIWCEYGRIKTKQSGRSHEPIYVPMVKTTTKGLMSPIERLEICMKLLNVANPLDPRGKLRTEKEIAEILGWDDILYPSQEDLDDYMKAFEKQMLEKAGQEEKGLKKKEQGQPSPQTEARQLKRQKGMETGSKKGKSKPMGGTRIPKAFQETETHYVWYRPFENLSHNKRRFQMVNQGLTHPEIDRTFISETLKVIEEATKGETKIEKPKEPVIREVSESKPETPKPLEPKRRLKPEEKSELQRVQLDINVKAEKREPQVIKIIQGSSDSPLDAQLKVKLAEKKVQVEEMKHKVALERKKFAEKQNELTDIQIKRGKIKIAKLERELDVIEAEKQKILVDINESRKTHSKKRKVMERIDEAIREEKKSIKKGEKQEGSD